MVRHRGRSLGLTTHVESSFKLIYWLYSHWCIFWFFTAQSKTNGDAEKRVSANSYFALLFCSPPLSFSCLLFCLFVHHGVFIHYCFALYIKTKVRPSSHKTPSSLPKKSLASSSRSPSVPATSAGPRESRPRVSTAADVLPLLWRMVYASVLLAVCPLSGVINSICISPLANWQASHLHKYSIVGVNFH